MPPDEEIVGVARIIAEYGTGVRGHRPWCAIASNEDDENNTHGPDVVRSAVVLLYDGFVSSEAFCKRDGARKGIKNHSGIQPCVQVHKERQEVHQD